MYKPQTVLITGATGDFGVAFSEIFAQHSVKVILHGRSQNKLDTLQKSLQEKFDASIHTLCFDITDTKNIQNQFDKLPDDFRNIDLLINNAGCALGQESADNADLQDWLDMITINNSGLVAITHAVLKIMRSQNSGHIINIGSTAGSYPYPGGHVYCAAKAFTKQFSLALRTDLNGKNIRVTNIEPGMVETQFSEVRFKGDKEKAAAVYEGAEALQAEDIAQSVLWTATQPPHVNINRIELMPTRQAPGPLIVKRKN